MANPATNFLALSFYIITGVLLAQRLAQGRPAVTGARIGMLSLALGAIVLHTAVLYPSLRLEAALNLSLTTAFLLVAWIVAVLYLGTALYRPVDGLGVIVMPLAGVTVLIAWWWPTQHPIALSSPWQALHIVISLLAYSLLCLA